MDLDTVLKKTKAKSEAIERNRTPVYVATKERPYELLAEKETEDQKKDSNKPTTNRKQTVNKPTTNRKQTVNKLTTNRKQTDYETVNKLTTKPTTSLHNNCSLYTLTGLQRLITLFVYQECKKLCSKITPPLTLEHLSHQTKTSKKSVKTSVYRLCSKGVISREEFKAGRGGWTKYKLSEKVFQEILQTESDQKLNTGWQQTVNKLTTEPTTQPTTNSSSSSSSNNNIKKTTTTELHGSWLEIDLSKAKTVFGFTQNHLLQLNKSGHEDPQAVEDSIQYFLFDLEHNGKAKEIKTQPLSYFMSILKKIGVYAAPDNYESPKQRTLRLYAERKQRLMAQELAIENECLTLEFEQWLNTLDEEQKKRLFPDALKTLSSEGAKTAFLRAHFKKTVWPEKKQQALRDT